jgi:hypothetical protein
MLEQLFDGSCWVCNGPMRRASPPRPGREVSRRHRSPVGQRALWLFCGSCGAKECIELGETFAHGQSKPALRR